MYKGVDLVQRSMKRSPDDHFTSSSDLKGECSAAAPDDADGDLIGDAALRGLSPADVVRGCFIHKYFHKNFL